MGQRIVPRKLPLNEFRTALNGGGGFLILKSAGSAGAPVIQDFPVCLNYQPRPRAKHFQQRHTATVSLEDEKYLIVGAGSSGLTVARALKQHGIAFDCVEREDDVGGNWYYGKPASSVYRSTHLISSKPMTEYPDFPMPEDYPDYPRHDQVFEYLRDYANHFGLYDDIEFNLSVKRIEPVDLPVPNKDTNGAKSDSSDPRWQVTFADGSRRRYQGVVIANGHLWDRKYPDYPGHFDGTVLHSADYKTHDVLVDRRVLIVGAGNSGCDIAVESAQNAAQTFHSTRRGYHYLPKYFMGTPADQLGERFLRWRLPLWMRRATASLMIKMVMGWPQDYGLPRPDHRLLESHPIVNSQLFYYVGHGEIIVKPDVERLLGDRVRFVDGSEEPIDVIVYATGFNIRFPFIDDRYLNWKNGRPDLYLNVFHPNDDSLFVAGLIQPDSGQFGLVHYQAQLIARFLAATNADASRADWFRRAKSQGRDGKGRKIRYLDSSRHLLEVEHYGYRRQLQKAIARFDARSTRTARAKTS